MAHQNTSTTQAPLLTIEPSHGWSPVDLRELWQFRELLVSLVGRDLRVRYKQTALGVAWVILQPLLGAGVLSFVFGKVADLPAPEGIPYFIFSFAGYLAWNVFSRTYTRAADSMVAHAGMISKIYFPRLILPLSTAFGNLIDFGVSLLMMLVMLVGWWHLPGWHVLMMPVCLLLLLLLALGAGLWAGAFAVTYRDVKHIQPVITQLLMFASPVAYAATLVNAEYRWLYYLNPLAPILETFKWSLLGVGHAPWAYLGVAAAITLAVLVSGAMVFRRMEREFADVV